MFRSLFVFSIAVALSHPAKADLVYTFGQSNYNVTANETVDVSVFLTQTSPGPINLAVDGIISGSVRVIFNETPPSAPAAVLALADIIPNPQFDETLLGAEFELAPGVSAGFVDGVDDIFAPLTGNSVLLGTFRFTAGGVGGEVTNLRATDFRILDDTIGGDFFLTAVDNSIADGFATITVVSTIPEPSTMAISSIALVGLMMRRRLPRARFDHKL